MGVLGRVRVTVCVRVQAKSMLTGSGGQIRGGQRRVDVAHIAVAEACINGARMGVFARMSMH